jgi:hypothetical protein
LIQKPSSESNNNNEGLLYHFSRDAYASVGHFLPACCLRRQPLGGIQATYPGLLHQLKSFGSKHQSLPVEPIPVLAEIVMLVADR